MVRGAEWVGRNTLFRIAMLAAGIGGCGGSADDRPTSTTQGTLAFHVDYIYYDPPGAGSAQRYEFSSANTPGAMWRTVDENGNSASVQVAIAEASDSVPDSSIVATTFINVAAGSDVPSGLFDEFVLAVGIPATLEVFPEGRPQRLTLDYTQSTEVFLSAQQLLALAQSAPDAQTLLQTTPAQGSSQIDAINTFITPDSAHDILLLDPAFVDLAAGGPLAARNPAQLAQMIEAHTDRFQPIALDNTLPVPAAPEPNNPGLTGASDYQPSNSNASSYGTGAQLEGPVSISVPGLGTRFDETYQRTTVDTAGSVTLQMGTPCLTGLADLYYDAAFGTYVYVSHDIQFVAEPFDDPAWYSQCTGNLGYFDGTACAADGDCASQVCAGGVCAPPACSPNCDVGSPCGMGGPFGDCGELACTNGLCAQ
ncbi:MAG TPA: hypothetical protein VI456_00705 [Polyangia bacterium]